MWLWRNRGIEGIWSFVIDGVFDGRFRGCFVGRVMPESVG